ncbi:hypothetical protein GOBAR_AA10186 [Gossypium barbadense]|uniref:Uncharacterized protein n=1 Tax=Gossypium barbadense TaxID=3634 RepID=A0A2P5Y4D0_GOSBA|nr:hypothetical protein GOBAR_AA10186 [Gossypium barbadense]
MIVMLKRFKLIKRGLQNMVIKDNISKAYLVKEKILDDLWWDKVDYILTFTEPIYDIIYRHERKKGDEKSIFYEVVYDTLIDRWTKSSKPLHCMAHSLNLSDWLNEVPNRLPPHKDVEILEERNKCLKRYFPSTEERKMRNWSTYLFIHSMRRNKINPPCAEDLVFVRTNLQILGVGILGVASLSLDEPEMEMVIFAYEEEDMENTNARN